MFSRSSRVIFAGVALFAFAGTSIPAFAQSSGDEARLRKLESEVRALQRKVFPGGDGRYFEPEISRSSPAGNGGSTSTTAVTDILVRLDALEAQIASLTSQTEENSNALVQLTNRVVALEMSPAATAGGNAASEANLSAMTGGDAGSGDSAADATVPSADPSPSRLAAVQQITKPQTDDPADDEYSYGFRLWNAGFYPEAQQQLTKFVNEHPDHWRTTYGRNLLGRAYLDDGKPNDAAPWFLRNYQANKQDARAPDSLLFLAESMIALDDTKRACIALAEFGDTYPALASGRLGDRYNANRAKVTCN